MSRRALALAFLVTMGAHQVALEEASAARRVRRGAVVAPVTLVATSQIPIEVAALHAYFGDIELRSAPDGIVIVNRLPLEEYLLGLNEVPTTWPEQALKAQAVAARTYALWTLEQPPGGSAATYGFDICATVACQVFSGADVLRLSSSGDRWAAAVRSTEGRAVTYRGGPILARYHSTSGGTTFANEQIFPSEGPFPYLKPVPSTTEERSPLYRWNVGFPVRRAQAILRRAGAWERRHGRLKAAFTTDSSLGKRYPDVVFRGSKENLRMSAEEFRVIVRTLAPEMYPAAYPSLALSSSGRLPETFPSNRLTVDTRGGRILVEGRGWGHGVGMSQWGAEGMARRGDDHEDILEHYYTGAVLDDYPDPGPVEVGVAWGLNETRVTGSFDIIDGRGRRIVAGAVGTWRFGAEGSGAVSIRSPRGFGLPLEIGVIEPRLEVEPGQAVAIPIALSAPAQVSTRSSEIGTTDPSVLSAGRGTVEWEAPAAPGTYDVTVVARASGERRTDRTTVVVVAEPEPAPSVATDPAAGQPSEGLPNPLIALIVVFVGGAAIFAFRKVTMGS